MSVSRIKLPDILPEGSANIEFTCLFSLPAMIFSSKLIQEAVREFSKLPGIGKKTALRMVLHLIKTEREQVDAFTGAIHRMRHEIQFCGKCHNVSDAVFCSICLQPGRNKEQVCVVENIRDVIAIENTGQYNGLYHVLGGVLSPLDGIGPDQLQVESLRKRVEEEEVRELIMALSPTMEGDTTVYYIARMLKGFAVHMTTIARGVAFGGELEYADENTLARSIARRQPVENYVNIS